jgi:NAD(P)-dependent dehydrogenase (short-subunit alcohol dehydrogenase family)
MPGDKPLAGKVALVAGATRGAGRAFAVELGAAGATVYATGRSTAGQRSEIDRPETIEETARRIVEVGGTGTGVVCDHLDRDQVRDLVARIGSEQGRLDVLVNNIWGGDHLTQWDTPLWQHDLDAGLRILRLAIDANLITSRFALPLLVREPGGLVIQVNDGTTETNADFYRGTLFYDLAKHIPPRIAYALSKELADHGGTAVSLTPGWIRSEAMLDHFGVTETNWRDGAEKSPHFVISETPHFVGRAAAALAADPRVGRWNGRSLDAFTLSQEYGFTDLDGTQPDAWRYIAEVEQAGRPADDGPYRRRPAT